MGRCCGAKHIAKSTCQKHFMLGELWDVEMWKKCTPLRHEAHVEVTHTHIFGALSEVEIRRCGAKHISKSTCSAPEHFWKLRC